MLATCTKLLTKLFAFGMVQLTTRAFGDGERRWTSGLPVGDSASRMIRVGLDGVTSIFMSNMSLVASCTDTCGGGAGGCLDCTGAVMSSPNEEEMAGKRKD